MDKYLLTLFPPFLLVMLAKSLLADPILYDMKISSNVIHRLAKTTVECKVKNNEENATQKTFTMELPELAHISKFIMEYNGEQYEAKVDTREKAEEEYIQASKDENTACNIAKVPGETTKFSVSIYIKPESVITFRLSYEEVLEHKNGGYELMLNIHPGQIVSNLSVEVILEENENIGYIHLFYTYNNERVTELTSNKKLANVTAIDWKKSIIRFSPTVNSQQEFIRTYKSSEGLDGYFVIRYELKEEIVGGEIIFQKDYFIHAFKSINLEFRPRHIIVVLDSSGSMYKQNRKTVEVSLFRIIEKMSTSVLSIVDFGKNVYIWDVNEKKRKQIRFENEENYENPFEKLQDIEFTDLVPNSHEGNLNISQMFHKLDFNGRTNIIAGLETGLVWANWVKKTSVNTRYCPVIFLLSDCDSNTGVASFSQAVNMIKSIASKDNVPIYLLNFGEKNYQPVLVSENKTLNFEYTQGKKYFDEFISKAKERVMHMHGNSPTTKMAKCPVENSECIIAGKFYVTLETRKYLEAKNVWNLDTTSANFTSRALTSLEEHWAYLTVGTIFNDIEKKLKDDNLEKKVQNLGRRYEFITKYTSLFHVHPVWTTDIISTREEMKLKNSAFEIFSAEMSPLLSQTVKSQVVNNGQDVITLFNMLPWLKSVLYDDGIIIDGYWYQIADGKIPVASYFCPITPLNTPGKCVHLLACPQIFSYLTNFFEYQQYFCPTVSMHAGVCCP